MDFYYQAKSAERKTVTGKITAETEFEALRTLKKRQLLNIKLQTTSFSEVKPKSKKIPLKVVAAFFRQWATFQKVGENISKSLQNLAKQTANEHMRAIIEIVKKDIDKGTPPNEALAKHSVFSSLAVNLVKVGETSSRLDVTLEEIADYMQRQYEMTQKVKDAVFYPKIVLTVLGIALSYVLFAVLPEFKNFYDGFDIDLPLPTAIMFAFSVFLQDFWFIVIPAVIGIILFIIRIPVLFKEQYHRYICKIPKVGEVVRTLYMYRFTRTMYVLMSSEVNLIETLDLTADTINNVWISRAIEGAKVKIKDGEGIAESLRAADQFQLFDPMCLNFIETGENTDKIPELMLKASEIYEKTLESDLNSLAKSLEPATIIPIGVVVGLLVLATYMPVFRMSRMIGH